VPRQTEVFSGKREGSHVLGRGKGASRRGLGGVPAAGRGEEEPFLKRKGGVIREEKKEMVFGQVRASKPPKPGGVPSCCLG